MTVSNVCIIGTNCSLNQSLVAILKISLDVKCSCEKRCPPDISENSSRENENVFLIDCLSWKKGIIKGRLQSQSILPGKGTKIVLFNVDTNEDFAEIINAKLVQGIFYRNDSRTLFIDGMRAIMDGGSWLKPHFVQSTTSYEDETKPDPEKALKNLSKREWEIFKCMASGMNNNSIADKLKISPHTVKTHIYNIYKKIGNPNRLQVVLYSTKKRMLDPNE